MPKKYYAVRTGRKTGIFENWDACKLQVHGYTGARFKSFKTREEAQGFCNGSADTTTAKHSSKPAAKKRAANTSETAERPTKRRAVPSGPRMSIMFDGGARGNPGIAGAGAAVVVVSENDRKSIHVRDYVGPHNTNNEAEYRGLISGLQVAVNQEGSPKTLSVQGDSKLIIQQLKGNWQCKKDNLIPLYEQAKDLLLRIERKFKCTITMEHVYRSDNKLADSLANAAMDAQRSWITTSDDDHEEQTPLY